MRHLFHLAGLSFVILAVALSGCGKKGPRPSPGDTVMGEGSSSTSRGDYVSPDWVSPESLNASEGLSLRSEDSGLENGEYSSDDIFSEIFFGFDEYFIAPAERPKLEDAADYLRSNPGNRVICVGHTDWYGTVEYNTGLGDRRASAVKNFLVQLGVPADRIETLSKGKLEATEGVEKLDPAAVQDRRVDVVVIE